MSAIIAAGISIQTFKGNRAAAKQSDARVCSDSNWCRDPDGYSKCYHRESYPRVKLDANKRYSANVKCRNCEEVGPHCAQLPNTPGVCAATVVTNRGENSSLKGKKRHLNYPNRSPRRKNPVFSYVTLLIV